MMRSGGGKVSAEVQTLPKDEAKKFEGTINNPWASNDTVTIPLKRGNDENDYIKLADCSMMSFNTKKCDSSKLESKDTCMPSNPITHVSVTSSHGPLREITPNVVNGSD